MRLPMSSSTVATAAMEAATAVETTSTMDTTAGVEAASTMGSTPKARLPTRGKASGISAVIKSTECAGVRPCLWV